MVLQKYIVAISWDLLINRNIHPLDLLTLYLIKIHYLKHLIRFSTRSIIYGARLKHNLPADRTELVLHKYTIALSRHLLFPIRHQGRGIQTENGQR